MFSHFSAVALAVIVLWVTAGVGRALLQRIGTGGHGAQEELTLSVALGVGLLGGILLVVAAWVGPRWYALWGTIALLAIVSWPHIQRIPYLLHFALSEVLAEEPGRRRSLAAISFAALLVVLILLAIQPPSDYDSLTYHLQVPNLWLLRGRLFLPGDNYHTAFIGVNDILYLPLISVGGAAAAQVLNLLIFLLLPVGVFATAKVVAGDRVGRLAFWFVFGSPILIMTGVTPMVDVTLAFVLIMANLAALKAAAGSGNARYLVLAGGLLGVAAGVKYLGLLYGVALVPVLVAALVKIAKRSHVTALRALGFATLSAVVMVAPWAVKNVVLFENPVFPVLSAPRVEPWLRPFYPELKPVGVDPAVFTSLTFIREPFSLLRFIVAPATITSNANAQDAVPFWPLLFAPLALLAATRWRGAAVVLPAIGYGALVLGYSRYTNLRYFIPMIPGLTVGAAVVVWTVREQLSRPWRKLLWGVIALVSLPSGATLAHLYQQRRPVAYALGRESGRAFLHRYWETALLTGAAEWVNTHTPPGAEVAMLFESRGFYFKRTVREDINIRNWAYLAPFAHAPSCLEPLGVSYVLVNDGLRGYFKERGMSSAALREDAFTEFRRECLVLRYSNRDVSVYAVRKADGAQAQE
jgi:hypothetical protein